MNNDLERLAYEMNITVDRLDMPLLTPDDLYFIQVAFAHKCFEELGLVPEFIVDENGMVVLK